MSQEIKKLKEEIWENALVIALQKGVIEEQKEKIKKLEKDLLWANQAAGQFLHAADHSNM